MNNPVRILLLGFVASVVLSVRAPAAVVLNETFSYPDGILTNVSSGVWSNHSGTLGQVDVASGKVNLTQAESEDVNTLLPGGPFASGNLYASFVINLSALPAGTGGYFAHFKDDGTTILRCRVFATVTGAAAGSYRVGIANGGTTPVIIATDLVLGTDYLLVIRYNTAAAASTLWINPGSEGTTSDRADGADTTTAPGITTFALRQSTASGDGMGVLTLDDLKVGTSFSDVAGSSPPVAPSITSQPQNAAVCAGGATNFNVSATGTEPLHYQWYFNDTNALADATNAMLTVTNVQSANVGGYSVVVTNVAGPVTSSPPALLLLNEPTAATGPDSQTLCPGQPTVFSVAASGTGPFSYVWRKDGGAPLSSASNLLAIASVSAADAGVYSVEVTGACNSVTNSATLAVNALTTAVGPVNQTICPGSSVTFTTVASGTGPFTYTWKKGATVLQGPDGNNSYMIASVVAGDAGTFTVEVNGLCNSVTNNATLTVVAVPTIIAQPQNQTTPMGNGAVFSVTATAAAPLTYQWQTNGVDVTGATGSSIAVSNLTLAANGTTFGVIVTDCAGSVTSALAVLTVTPVSGISFDFNTPGQYTNAPYYLTYNNWINGGFLPGIPVPTVFESPIGGVGPFPGGGGLDMSPNQGNESTSILLPVNFDFSLTGKTVFASTMFKVKTPITAGRRATQFGLVTSTNLGINDQTPQGFAAVIVQDPTAGTPSYELRSQRRTTGGGVQESLIVAATPLTVSNWYKLNVTFLNTKSAAIPSNFTIVASVQDMGPLGTTPGATNMSFTTTTNNADIANFKNVYLALRSFEDGGMEARDNMYAWTTPGNIFFVQAPQSQTVVQGNRAQFKALVDGEGPYTYVWQRGDGSGGFTNIPLAGSWNYITPPVRLTDNGTQFRVVVTGPANSITSAPVALTISPQELAVVSAGSVDGTTVGVLFNQPVDPATAENEANYTINGVNPSNARVYRSSLGALGPEGIYVVLTPASVVAGPFTVVVSGVRDLSGGGAVGAANSASGTVAGLTGFDVNPAITGPPGENYSFGAGQFIISGGGPDIAGSADGFRFVYTTRTGDFDIKTRVPYMDTIRFVSKAGFDARISLNPFSPMVVASFNPGPMAEGSGTLRQFSEGNVRNTWNVGTGGWGNNTRMFHPDVWLRLRRAGNTFLRYSSTNGVNWVFDGQTSPTTIFPPTIYVGLAVSAVRNLFTESAQFENYGEFAGYPGAAIAITSPPTNFTVNAGSSFTDGLVATLSGGGAPAGAGELTYVWQRNDGSGTFTNLPTAGATNNTVSIGPLFGLDNGAQFRCIVRAPGAAEVISATFTATVNDTTAPTLTSANGAILPSYQASEVTLIFSENVSAASATDIANYTVTNAAGVRLTVLSATFLGGDLRNILLKVDGPLGSGTSTVGISGVRDQNNNLIGDTVRTFRSFLPSTAPVVVEVYQDIGGGTAPSDLTGNALFTGGTPTFICYSNLFGFNVGLANLQDNYGVKIYSYFVPPTNGNYKFWIRGDDGMVLFMNTNGVDPAGKTMIASNFAFISGNYAVGQIPADSKTNITLTGGQPYYIELLGKEGGGGDGFSVMWTDPSVNTAPAATVFIPTANLAYPASAAPSTPVVMDVFTGYQNFLPGFNQMAGLTSATNFPTGNYALEVVNFKYIAGIPDVIGYQKYFGAQPVTLGNTRLDNYLGRIQSYFIAPSTGLYRFWMGVDDVGQLYMNTNAVNSTDPAGMVLLGVSANAFVSVDSQLVAQNVPLIGGQKYYMMALWREGGGGDGIRIAVRPQSDSSQPPPTEVIPASMLEYPLAQGRAGMVNFTGIVPANPMVPDGQSVTLAAAGIVGAPHNAAGSVNGVPYGYYWLKNGVRVLENSFTNITQPLTMADNGSVYTLVVSNWFSSMARSVTITVLPDNTAPTVASCVGFRYGDGFNIIYSEPVDPVSATFLGNYQVSGGLMLLSATLDPSGKMVSFRTTPQAAGTAYNITINGVKDASSSGNVIAANTMTSFSTWTVGGSGFMVELFTNIPNSTISDLTGQPKFVNNQPDVVYYTNVFGVGLFNANSTLENYGARITGYFIPTATSNYRFYVRSDDASQFWMNINSTDSENPAGRTLLIHMPNANVNVNDARAISPPVPLNAGQRYYVEGLMKEGTGSDYLQVIFRQTDAAGTSLTGNPVDNTAAENSTIAMFGGSGVPGNPDAIQILQTPPTDLTVGENDPVSLSLVASVPSSIALATSYQWQRFSGATYTNIPGATGPNLNFFAALADNNTQYRIVFSAPGRNASYVTLLHVTNDITAPYVVSAHSLDGQTIGVCFNERLTTDSAEDEFNYTVNGGSAFVSVATLRPDGHSVVLTLQTPITGQFTLLATNVVDLSQAMNSGGNTVTGRVQNFVPLDVGAPAAAGSSFSCLEGEIDVIAGGNDIWGTGDVGHLTLSPRSGDFDIHARIQSLTPADPAQPSISKAGFMIRQTLDANSTTIYHSVNPPPPRGRDLGEVGQRSTVGGATALFAGSASYTPASIPNAWVRAQRRGNIFSFFRSSDGLNWIQVASGPAAFSNQVFIGLATTAHTATQAPGLTTLAEYRNIYIPDPPTILVPPAPASQTVPINSMVSYSVTASNPPNSGLLTYQWLRNGLVIPNQTNSTLNLSNLTVADSGLYSVNAGNDGGATVSTAASLTVSNALPILGADSISATQNMAVTISGASLLANDSDPEGAMLSILGVNGVCSSLMAANFDRGLPPNSTAYVNAFVDATGGVNNSGVLKLTLPTANQGGVFYTSDLGAGAPVVGFRASFKILVSQGSGNPADGFSLSFANDLPNPPGYGNPGEEGAGSGLIVAFDNYDNGGAEAPAIDVKWAGAVIPNGHVSITKIQNTSYLDVVIQLDPDGTLDVMFGGNTIFNNLPTPYVPITGGLFALGARTGGEVETHWVDDLNITVVNRTPKGGLVSRDSTTGQITYTPAPNTCGTDSFVYQVSDGQEGGITCGVVNVNVSEAVPAPPVITACPTNRTYMLTNSSQMILPDLTGELSATDNCCCVSTTQNPPAGTVLGTGPSTVTFTVTDGVGLNTTCLVTVKVVQNPVLSNLSYSGGSFSASFPTAIGFNYTVQYKDHLNDPEWTMLTVGGFSVIPGTGNLKTFMDLGPLPPTRFYRVCFVP